MIFKFSFLELKKNQKHSWISTLGILYWNIWCETLGFFESSSKQSKCGDSLMWWNIVFTIFTVIRYKVYYESEMLRTFLKYDKGKFLLWPKIIIILNCSWKHQIIGRKRHIDSTNSANFIKCFICFSE